MTYSTKLLRLLQSVQPRLSSRRRIEKISGVREVKVEKRRWKRKVRARVYPGRENGKKLTKIRNH